MKRRYAVYELFLRARLLAYRELDERFGLTRSAAGKLVDARTGKNAQHTMLALLRRDSGLGGMRDRAKTMVFRGAACEQVCETA